MPQIVGVVVAHVDRGTVTIEFADRSIVLGEHDTLTFPGRTPHNWHAGEHGALLTWTLVPAAWSGSK